MKSIRKKIIISSLIGFSATTYSTDEFGYLEEIATGNYFVEIQTLDTGHDPRLLSVTRDADMSNCSGEFGYAQLGCYPYIFKPNTTNKMSGVVFPFQHFAKGERVIKLIVYSGDGTVKNTVYFQDQAGKLCIKTQKENWKCPEIKRPNKLVFFSIIVKPDGQIDYIARSQQRRGSRTECAGSAGKIAGYEIALRATQASRAIANGVLEAAKQVASGTLDATRVSSKTAAETALKAANGVLDEIAPRVVSGSLGAARVVGTGALIAAREATVMTLEGVLKGLQLAMSGFNVEKIHFEGNVQDLAHGKLQNVEFQMSVLRQTLHLKFDLDVHDPISSVKSLANVVVDKIIGLVKK